MYARLLWLSDVLDAAVSLVGRLAAWLALALIAVIMLDVITRRLFVLGSTRLQELEWHLHGTLLLLVIGFAYLRNAHVRIEIFREQMSPRGRAIVEMIGCLLLIAPFCWLMVNSGYTYAYRAFVVGEGSPALTGLPHRFIIKGMIPLGFALVAMAALAVFARCFVFAFGPAALRQRAGAIVADVTLVESGATGPDAVDERREGPGT